MHNKLKFQGLPEISMPVFDLCKYLTPECPIEAGASASFIQDFGLQMFFPPELLPVSF